MQRVWTKASMVDAYEAQSRQFTCLPLPNDPRWKLLHRANGPRRHVPPPQRPVSCGYSLDKFRLYIQRRTALHVP